MYAQRGVGNTSLECSAYHGERGDYFNRVIFGVLPTKLNQRDLIGSRTNLKSEPQRVRVMAGQQGTAAASWKG